MYPVSSDEPMRLNALRKLDRLQAVDQENFDRIVRMASQIFSIPTVLISFVDAGHQWFKAKTGFDANSTDRKIAFCNYTIMSDDVMVVPDAKEDYRFKDNPLVTDNPYIRFYAGAPLSVRNGLRVGALCMLDNKPRVLNDEQKALLCDLAGITTELVRSAEFSRRLIEASETV